MVDAVVKEQFYQRKRRCELKRESPGLLRRQVDWLKTTNSQEGRVVDTSCKIKC